MKSSLIRCCHKQTGRTAYRLQARPALTGPDLRLTAMRSPGLPFNGRHPHDPCKYMDLYPVYRPHTLWPRKICCTQQVVVMSERVEGTFIHSFSFIKWIDRTQANTWRQNKTTSVSSSLYATYAYYKVFVK